MFSVNHIYEKNLLLNSSGEKTSPEELVAQENRSLDEEFIMSPWPNYPQWKIWSSGGQGWKVLSNGAEYPVNPKVFETYPQLKKMKKEDLSTHFFTSYHSCSKEQVLDLISICRARDNDGLPDALWQKSNYQVRVKISEWFCFVGPCTLDLKVTFLNSEKKAVQDVVTYRSPKKELQKHWNYLEMVTQICLSNVRYIKFYHGGTCNENIEDEEMQKQVGTCFAQGNISLSFPFEDKTVQPLFIAKQF